MASGRWARRQGRGGRIRPHGPTDEEEEEEAAGVAVASGGWVWRRGGGGWISVHSPTEDEEATGAPVASHGRAQRTARIWPPLAQSPPCTVAPSSDRSGSGEAWGWRIRRRRRRRQGQRQPRGRRIGLGFRILFYFSVFNFCVRTT